jgi:hypothetical protein
MDFLNRQNGFPLGKEKGVPDSILLLNTIEKRLHDEILLSFAQERVWFIEQLDPENPVQNISAALKFQGEVDIELLEKSINKVVGHLHAIDPQIQTRRTDKIAGKDACDARCGISPRRKPRVQIC